MKLWVNIFDVVLLRYKKFTFIALNCQNYLAIWLYFVFITSVVITNAVKGTTVAFIMGYMALAIPLVLRSKKSNFYYTLLGKFLLAYFCLCLASQASVLLSGSFPPTANLTLISPETNFFLKSSLFTQSLYVIPSFALLCFVITYYTKAHEKHLIRALLLFIAFGYYKVIFFALIGINGDFLSNRMFSDGVLNPAQFQTFTLVGQEINRFVSLTGEPSMYVFATFPYFVYFLYKQKKLISFLLFSSLLLTFSGTFAMGLALLGLFHFLLAERNLKRAGILLAGLLLIPFLLPADMLNAILKEVLIDKINQESTSGIERTQSFLDQIDFYINAPFLTKLFGVGFGAVRATDFFSTLLVNIGLVGLLLFTLLFGFPIYKLPRSERGLRIALMITYFMLLVSVSEYSYPSLWLFLGLAYSTLFTHERLRQRSFLNSTNNGYSALRY